MVEKIWSEAHPEIPILASGLNVDGVYPCIVYSISNRVTHPGEPKPRQAEQPIKHDDNSNDVLIIYRQRFINFVKFEVVGKIEQNGAHIVEELVEIFEDFMMTYHAIFREKGLSEMTYERRLPDDEESRSGEGVVSRSVVYRVVTEKLIHVTVSKLEEISATITIGGNETENESATPTTQHVIPVQLLET